MRLRSALIVTGMLLGSFSSGASAAPIAYAVDLTLTDSANGAPTEVTGTITSNGTGSLSLGDIVSYDLTFDGYVLASPNASYSLVGSNLEANGNLLQFDFGGAPDSTFLIADGSALFAVYSGSSFGSPGPQIEANLFGVSDVVEQQSPVLRTIGVAPVPLPTASAMFGTALLALGTVGSRVTRRRAAPAV